MKLGNNLIILVIGLFCATSFAGGTCNNEAGYKQSLVSKDGRLVAEHAGDVFIYEPIKKTTDCFAYRNSLGNHDWEHPSIILADGRLAILDADPVYKLYLINLDSQVVEKTIEVNRYWYRLIETSDHRIMVSNGNAAAIFNLETGLQDKDAYVSWTPSTAAAISGKVIFFNFGKVVGEFIEQTNSFHALEEPTHDSTDFATAKVLSNGQILVVGGADSSPGGKFSRESYLYDPQKNRIIRAFLTGIWFNGFEVTELSGLRVLISGGQPQVGSTSSMRDDTKIISLKTGAVTTGPSMLASRKDHVFIPTKEGNFIVAGGYRLNYSGQPESPAIELFDVKELIFKSLNVRY